jgi:major membrane immunogen (membrane-anchored lipoprotein)
MDRRVMKSIEAEGKEKQIRKNADVLVEEQGSSCG